MNKEVQDIDHSKEFIGFPNLIYGRDQVVHFLKQGVLKFEKEGFNAICLEGPAGVGKSYIVKNFFRDRGPIYLRGKYNQFKKSVPFQAWSQFIQEGLIFLKEMDASTKSAFKTELKNSLQNDDHQIARVIPGIGEWLDIKAQKENHFDSTLQIQNRLYSALYSVIDCIIQFSDQKVVAHLDDVQWSDEESVVLVERIIANPIKNLLLVLTQRPVDTKNDVDRLSKIKNDYNSISIKTLVQKDCEKLVEDIFGLVNEDNAILADILMDSSEGNPLLIKENIAQLIERQILEQDKSSKKWVWNPVTNPSDEKEQSLEEIIQSKIQNLESQSRSILEMTACFGYKVSVPFVSAITDIDKNRLIEVYSQASAAGIMKREEPSPSFKNSTEITFVFANDSAQAALMSVIPEKTKIRTHQQIAQYYINSAATGLDDRDVYECAYHLNECIHEDSNELIKDQHLMVNILALEKAKKSASFSVAMNYLNQAMDSDLHYNWKSGYESAAKLRIQGYEVARLTDRISMANRFYTELLEKGKPEEILRIQFSKVMMDVQFGNLQESLNTGIEALKRLGLNVPSKPGIYAVIKELIKTKLLLFNKKPEDFFDLPKMTDADAERSIQFCTWMMKSAYYLSPELSAILSLKMVQQTWKKGTCAESFAGLMAYGIISAAGTNNYIKAHQWCEVGDKLAAKHGNHSATYYFGKGVYTAFTKHLPDTLPWYTIAVETAYENGDFISSAEPTVNQSLTLYSSGEKLDVLLAKVHQSLMYCDSLMMKDYRDFQSTFHLQLRKLKGDKIKAEEQKKVDDVLAQTQYKFSRDIYYFMELQRLCFEGRWKDAFDLSQSKQINVQAFTGLYVQAEYYFYLAVAALMNPDNRKVKNRIKNYFLVSSVLRKMKKWSAACEENHEHKRQIVLGLKYLRAKKTADAQQALMKGADLAKQKGFIQNSALANYFVAEIYDAQNEEKNAQTFRKKSIRQFKEWGTSLMN